MMKMKMRMKLKNKNKNPNNNDNNTNNKLKIDPHALLPHPQMTVREIKNKKGHDVSNEQNPLSASQPALPSKDITASIKEKEDENESLFDDKKKTKKNDLWNDDDDDDTFLSNISKKIKNNVKKKPYRQ